MKKSVLFKAFVFTMISTLVFASSYLVSNASANNVLEEMDSISNWSAFSNCSIAPDTTNKVSGTASIQITPTNAGGDFNICTIVDANKDISAMHNIQFDAYVTNVSQINTLAIFLMSDWGNFYYAYIDKSNMVTGWNHFVLGPSHFSTVGTPKWSTINKLWFRGESVDNAKPVINIDKIAYSTEGKSNIILTFDDGWKGTSEIAYPAMKARNMVGTVWTCKGFTEEADTAATDSDPSTVSEFMTTPDISTLYNNGWDIGNHTVDHPDDITKLTKAQKKAEYLTNMNWLNANKWTRGSMHACYPCGSFDTQLISILPTIGVKTGRSCIYGLETSPPKDLFRIKTIAIGRDTDINFIKGLIDTTVQDDATFVVMFHEIAAAPDQNDPEQVIFTQTEKFTQVLDYIKSYVDKGSTKVQPVSSWYNEFTAK